MEQAQEFGKFERDDECVVNKSSWSLEERKRVETSQWTLSSSEITHKSPIDGKRKENERVK